MIGSLMSRLDEAQNLSVSQLQKAVQDGTLPAYIGIPLIQDKIQLQKAAQAPQMPPQPPIAQQVMQEADGIDRARTNLPVRMAPGGIVGMDPEDSDYDDPLLQSALEDIDREQSQYGAQNVNMPMGEGISSAIMATSDNTKPAFSSITKPIKEGIEKLSNFINRTPKVDEVTKEKPSLHENFIGAIRHIESRGNRYDSLGRLLESPKGAKGEMQVMDKTFKDPGFGVTPARDNSAEERRRVGEDYATALLNKYQDPVIAGMAYNAGPGRIDKWLASGMKEKLPQETVDYGNKLMNIINKFKEGGITKLKEGGKVMHFQNTGLVDDIDKMNLGPRSYGVQDTNYQSSKSEPNMLERFFTFNPAEQRRIWENGVRARENFLQSDLNKKPYNDIPIPPGVVVPPGGPRDFDAGITSIRPTPSVNPYDVEDYEMGRAMKNPTLLPTEAKQNIEPTKENKPDQSTAESTPSPYAGFLQAMQDQLGELKNQKEEDKYMSLLAAGLGMMGGTSPFAGVNIGQGALAGVQNYANAAKQRGAEQAALYRNMLYGQHFMSADEMAKAKLAQDEQFKNMLYGQKAETLDEAKRKALQLEQDRAMQIHERLDNHIVSQAKLLYPPDKDLINPLNVAKREEYIAKMQKKPSYLKSYQRAFPDIDMSEFNAPETKQFSDEQLSKYKK